MALNLTDLYYNTV